MLTRVLLPRGARKACSILAVRVTVQGKAVRVPLRVPVELHPLRMVDFLAALAALAVFDSGIARCIPPDKGPRARGMREQSDVESDDEEPSEMRHRAMHCTLELRRRAKNLVVALRAPAP